MVNFLQPLSQDFATKILCHIQRYITILPKRNSKKVQLVNKHHTIHHEITKLVIHSCKITPSCYLSSLTCPTQLTQYNSSHTRDIIFGFVKHPKSSKWSSVGLAYPADHNTVKPIHQARMATKEDTQAITILIANHKYWILHQLSITKHAKTHTIVTIPPQYKLQPNTKMAKILSIHIIAPHIHNMYTQPIIAHNEHTKPQVFHHIIQEVTIFKRIPTLVDL